MAILNFCKQLFITHFQIMGLSVLWFLIISIIGIFSDIHIIEAKRSTISREEDLELERQLKILNKPPIKTIQVQSYFCYGPALF